MKDANARFIEVAKSLCEIGKHKDAILASTHENCTQSTQEFAGLLTSRGYALMNLNAILENPESSNEQRAIAVAFRAEIEANTADAQTHLIKICERAAMSPTFVPLDMLPHLAAYTQSLKTAYL